MYGAWRKKDSKSTEGKSKKCNCEARGGERENCSKQARQRQGENTYLKVVETSGSKPFTREAESGIKAVSRVARLNPRGHCGKTSEHIAQRSPIPAASLNPRSRVYPPVNSDCRAGRWSLQSSHIPSDKWCLRPLEVFRHRRQAPPGGLISKGHVSDGRVRMHRQNYLSSNLNRSFVSCPRPYCASTMTSANSGSQPKAPPVSNSVGDVDPNLPSLAAYVEHSRSSRALAACIVLE